MTPTLPGEKTSPGMMPPRAAARGPAPAANGAGTKMSEQFACVAATASRAVSNTGTPSISAPPRPGVTPARTFVPYSMQRRVWKEPSRPVIPWTRRRVWEPTRMLTRGRSLVPPRPARRDQLGAVAGLVAAEHLDVLRGGGRVAARGGGGRRQGL